MQSIRQKLTANWLRMVRSRPLDADSPLEEVRRRHDLVARGFGPLVRDASAEPATIASGVRGEWVAAQNARADRVILYLHGGGFVAGSPEAYRPFTARLSKAAEARVFVLAYRLAPEHPFPAALRDSVDAFRALAAQSGSPERVAVGGDGAGGGLALSLLMALRNGGAGLPACYFAFSPWVDLSLSGWSVMTQARRDALMSWELLFLSARHYLGATNPADIYASPLFGDFRGLPPIMVHAGADEMLRDDASRIGERAAEAGVQVSVEIYERMQHLFQALPYGPQGSISLQRIGGFIKSRIGLPAGRAPGQGLFRRAAGQAV